MPCAGHDIEEYDNKATAAADTVLAVFLLETLDLGFDAVIVKELLNCEISFLLVKQ